MASKDSRPTKSFSTQRAQPPASPASAHAVAASQTPAHAPAHAAAQTPAPAAASAVSVATPPAAAIAASPAISASRDRSTVVALISRLRDHDAEIARDAAATLGRLPADAQAVDALGDVLRNADGYFHSVVRAAAAASLGHLGDARALDALIAATRDSMAEASQEAIKALGQLGDVRALPVLREVVKNENGFFLENVRNTAQDAITRLTRKSA